MNTHIPDNTLCADGRTIKDRQRQAQLEHKDAEVLRLAAMERRHMAYCQVCNASLRPGPMVRKLFGEHVRVLG